MENNEGIFDAGEAAIINSDYRAVSMTDSETVLRHSIDASGNWMETRKLVDISGIITNSKNGKRITLTMGKCRFGGSRFNLCSLTKMTDSGWKMSGNTSGIYLEKGDIIIHFDIPITTPEGRIWAI